MDNKLDPKVGALYTRPRRLDLGDHAMLDGTRFHACNVVPLLATWEEYGGF